MKLPISQRLLTCCGFVAPGSRVADVGCDHGYLGIYLLMNQIASSVIASDVRPGPLQCAVINAKKFGVEDRMSFYLTDGVRAIPRDFNTLVCAGMGADTMVSILEGAPWLQSSQYQLILQCQSKRPMLRRYLAEHGFRISRETLAKDGKFLYPVMQVCYAPGPLPAPWEFYISPQLLDDSSPLFPEFLARVIGALEENAKGTAHSGSREAQELTEILEHLHTLERK